MVQSTAIGKGTECKSIYKNGGFPLSPVDLAHIATQFTLSYVVYDEPGYFTMKRSPHGNCFLKRKDGLCTLYKQQPLSCKLTELDKKEDNEKSALVRILGCDYHERYGYAPFNLLEHLEIPTTLVKDDLDIEGVVGEILKMGNLRKVLDIYGLPTNTGELMEMITAIQSQ
jgi:Fe-S-cluster containining protein